MENENDNDGVGHERTTVIQSEKQFMFCPLCGEELERDTFTVRKAIIAKDRYVTKKNTEVICPNHGVLVYTTR